MATITKTISIDAPPEKVFAYIDEPSNNIDWIVGMTDMRDLVGAGVGRHFQWTFKMAGLPLKAESTTVEHVASKRLVTKSKGGIVSTWSADLESEGEGTKLTMEIDYTIPVPVLGKLAENLVLKRNESELELSLQNIKDAVEAG